MEGGQGGAWNDCNSHFGAVAPPESKPTSHSDVTRLVYEVLDLGTTPPWIGYHTNILTRSSPQGKSI